jgi:hypothetical protein
MKKRNITLWCLILLGSLYGAQVFAQANVNMPYNTGVINTFTANTNPCTFFNFYDNNGPATNYSNSSNPATSVVTFAPTNAGGKIRAIFTSFASEPNFDALYVYDGTTSTVANITNTAINTIIPGQIPSANPQSLTFRAGGWWGAVAPNNLGLPAGQVQATAGNATGALTFQFDSDISVTSAGWVATVLEAPPAANCPLVAPANQTLSTGTTDCSANVTITVPAIGACFGDPNFSLRYSLNGGAFVNLGSTPPAQVTLLGVPKGVNTVLWQIVSACGNLVVSSASHTITVVDQTKPVITCPANITLNLDPGFCSTQFSYTVPFTDNCPLTVSQAAWALDTSVPHLVNSSLSCSVGPNHYFQVLDLPVGAFASGFQATFARIGVNSAYTVNSTFQVRLWRLNNPALPYNVSLANRTLLAQSNAVPLPAGLGAQGNINIPISVAIPAGATVLLEVQASAPFSVGNQGGGGGVKTYLGATPCGISPDNPVTFASLGFPGNDMAAVLYGLVSVPGFGVQYAGLPSGAEFPIGTTTNCFTATDVAGNTSTCCFTVTVQEYPNAISTLVCNDFVYVSLDEDCTEELGADQILEGGPYGCYDDYIVEIDRTPPYGNGPWQPAVLGPNDVGKTYAVRVTDPETGNSCWGNLKVEDKLAPVLDCGGPFVIPCNIDPVPLPFDACPEITGGEVTLTQNVAFTNYWTGYMGNVVNLSGANLTMTKVRVQASLAGAAAGTYNLRCYMRNGTYVGNANSAAGWTQVGSINANITAGFPTVLLFDIPFTTQFTIPGGQTAGFYVVANNGAGTTVRVVATLGAADTDDGTLRIDNPGNWVNGLFGGVAFANEQTRPQIAFTYISTIKACVPLPNNLSSEDVTQNGDEWIVNAGAGSPVLDNCSNVTLTYSDSEVDNGCAGGVITRKWTAKDASGNTSTCNQIINVILPKLGDVQIPPSYDDIDEDALECGSGQYPSPDYLEQIGLQGYPHVFGQPSGCTIGWTYTDNVIDVCDGTYKIVRKWFIVDWCTGDDLEVNQVIKVLDEEGPSITCPANMTVSTDPFSCCAIVDLPDVIVSDNCSRINSISAMIVGRDQYTNEVIGMFTVGGNLTDFPGNNWWNPDTLAAFGLTPCLPISGNFFHEVTYTVTDDCGNTATCSFRLTVRDLTPPVAACDEYTVVAIGLDDPYDCYGPAGFQDNPPALGDCEGAGVTWVKAKTFDDGSYDNCANVKFTVQRMGPYSDCIQSLNSIRGVPDCASQFPSFPSEFERAISEGDSIKFYCCEVGTTQMVILRVYQLDVNGNLVIGPDGSPVHNSCMVEVEVQDKVKPACVSPANVTVSCEAFDPSLWAYGKATVKDNCCLDTTKVYQGQCGLEHTANYNLFDTVCNRGTITRTFRAYDCHGQSSQCTQRIIVNYTQDYYVKFPNDVVVPFCDSSGVYGEPTFFGEDCELLGVSYEDQIFTVVPDACFKIERTWTIINWCKYNPDLGCIDVPNPNPNATVNNPANFTGPVVSDINPDLNPTNPWRATKISITPGAPQTIYTQYWGDTDGDGDNDEVNCYRYKQIIKIVDQQKPTVDCPASPVEYCDLSANDPQLWNQSYWWDNSTESHDLCEGEAALCITATDDCSKSNVNISYLLFLDTDGDGTMETVVSSNNPPAPGTVRYNNIGSASTGYNGGVEQVFDGRPVPSNQIYRWALHQTVSGNSKTGCVQWKTLAQMPTPNNPNGTAGVAPQLPYGTHKIKWTITDGCGNERTCEYEFVVKDCKAPSVVCYNGLSTNIMAIGPNQGMAVVWASDFLQYGDDNCTPDDKLKYSIRKAGQGTGFPVDPITGLPITSLTFDCTEMGPQAVELWVMDLAGNADFCQTFIDVQDNAGVCSPDNKVDVAGALKTEGDEGLEDANVNLQSGVISLFDMTDADGQYQFANAVPSGSNYTVTPTKDDNPLNGVSTYDLVLISKHILGLEPLGSPYKMIAADANKSNSITTFDIVEIRKLILGIYSELPNNTSWRFVDKGFAFPNPANPFQTQFPETKSVASVTVDQLADNFVAVKVGDVNGTAIPNALITADDRTASTLLFDVEDRLVKAGETFTVNFRSAERTQGWQFTLNLNGLEVSDISSTSDKVTRDNFGVFADALTASVDADATDFSVTFRAVKSGILSEMLGISSRITRAEAYSLANARMDVALRFNGQNGSVISGVGFELYQNQPNPFVNKTVIGFHLPEAADATLTIFDETGRMLFTQKGSFAKGYNAIAIDRALLNTNGLMYYKLETATDSATKKMIQTK